MKIVVLDGHVANPGDLSWGALASQGELYVYKRTLPSEIATRCEGAEAIFTNKVVISAQVMDSIPSLRFIGVLATGYNNVDVAAARERGITVCNVPDYSSDSVAQLVFSYILHFACPVGLFDESVHQGDWCASPDFSYYLGPITELAGMTIGIYGLGNIGRRVAAIAHAFGMRVISPTRQSADAIPEYVEKVTFDRMLVESDIISVNSPLTDENRGIFNAEAFAKMSPTAFFINTARGPLVDERALAEALATGQIHAAAVDVLSVEPPSPANPLLSAPRCLITPHVAWQTVAARKRLLQISADNLRAFVDGHPQNVVS